MVEIRPLRGIRFDPAVTGGVGPLLAPPYDVAAAEDGYGVFSIRRIEEVDLGGVGNDHALAAERYRSWLEHGVLRRDEAPAVYLHRHQFQAGGRSLVRTGLLARVRLTDWEERAVLPHERTTPGPRRERLERLRAVNANLSPLYFLYRDPNREIRDLVSLHAPTGEQHERDRMGGSHQLSALVDPALHEALREAFARRTVFVADGHHRYEAALAYRDECRRRHGYDPDSPWEFVLTLLAAVEDPGVQVLPTHRLVFGSTAQARVLQELLERWFRLVPADAPTASLASDPLFRVMLAGAPHEWAVFARPGNPHLSLLPDDRSEVWRSLDVSVLSSVLESFLGVAGAKDASRVLPVVDGSEVERQIRNGQAMAAFVLPSPRLNRLLAVAEAGDLLPAKSTWFEPKAPAGLVINDLSW